MAIDRKAFDNLIYLYKLAVHKYRKGEEWGVYVTEENLISLENEMAEEINKCHEEALTINEGKGEES